MQELDIEEIESRLYGQVFHSVPEDTSQSTSTVEPNNLPPQIITNIPQRQVSNFSINNVLPKKSRYWNSSRPTQIEVVINNDFIPIQNDPIEKQTVVINNTIPLHFKQWSEKQEQRRIRRREKKKRKKLAKLQKALSENSINCVLCVNRPSCVCNINTVNPYHTTDYNKQNTSVNSNKIGSNSQYVEMAPFYAIRHLPTRQSEKNSVDNQNNTKNLILDAIIVSDSDDDSVQYVEPSKSPVYLIESDSDSSIVVDEINSNKETTIIDNKVTEEVYKKEENINTAMDATSNNNLLEVNISENGSKHISSDSEGDEEIDVGSNQPEFQDKSEINIDDKTHFTEDITNKNKLPIDNILKFQNIDTEISCTPDSTNDFIDNDISEERQFQFNFSLHGSDLDLTERETTNSTKISASELFETESSCSGTVTPTKNSYNEPNFDVPKNIFCEEDLSSFSNFITPKRDDKKRKSGSKNEQISTKALKVLNIETLTNKKEILINKKHDKINKETAVTDTPNIQDELTKKSRSKRKEMSVLFKRRKLLSRQIAKCKLRIGKLGFPTSTRQLRICRNSESKINSCTNELNEVESKIAESNNKRNNKNTKHIRIQQENESSKNSDTNIIRNLDLSTNNKIENKNVDIKRCQKANISPKIVYNISNSAENITKPNVSPKLKFNSIPESQENKLDGSDVLIIESNLKIEPPKQNSSPANLNIPIKNDLVNLKSPSDNFKLKTKSQVIMLDDSDNEDDKDQNSSEKKFYTSSSEDEQLENTDIKQTKPSELNKNMPSDKQCESSDSNENNEISLNIYSIKSNSGASTSKELPTTVEENENLVKNPFSQTERKKNFIDFWTYDMNEFYDKSSGQENFDVNAIIKTMPSDPEKWKIIDDDKNIFKKPTRRKFCVFCRRDGHMIHDCPKLNNRETVKCSMCGDEGHMKPRCPNLICTTCGNREGYLTTSCRKCQHFKTIKCNICKLMGHPEDICPDLWRRYHLSKNEHDNPVKSSSKLKPYRDQWCSGCAKKGHLYHECRRVIREHFQTLPYVVNYESTYNRNFQAVYNRNITPEPQIPQMNQMTLSELSNYRNSMTTSNTQKYGIMIKKLMQECSDGRDQYLKQLRHLERDLQRNNFSNKIGTLYRLKKMIRKTNIY